MNETIHNMKRRQNEHDYSGRCIYMVTIETEGRKALLGQVAGESAETAHVELTQLGREVERAWRRGGEIYKDKGVRLITYQVMPDHFHGLLFLTKDGEITLGQVINGFKVGCNRAYTQLMKDRDTAAGRRSTEPVTETTDLPSSVADGKQTGEVQTEPVGCAPAVRVQGASTPVSGPHSPKGLLWAHGYHDRILTNSGQLDVLINYIHDNPRRAWIKRMNHAYFVQHDVRVGGTTFRAIGNDLLLSASKKIQVQVSRRYHRPDATDSVQREWADMRDQLLQAARNGAVLVSPCISRGEQEVARMAKEEGLPLIVLLENGFAEHYKPMGTYFEACAAGRLLMLAPWEHHTERRAISRVQCMQLNAMAKDIVNN
ncbi:MAG: hypothetical protein KBS99_02270 [Prevotellaceae bacterium]|nr:hypothetical protein [Candidatus Colivivens caballi]